LCAEHHYPSRSAADTRPSRPGKPGASSRAPAASAPAALGWCALSNDHAWFASEPVEFFFDEKFLFLLSFLSFFFFLFSC